MAYRAGFSMCFPGVMLKKNPQLGGLGHIFSLVRQSPVSCCFSYSFLSLLFLLPLSICLTLVPSRGFISPLVFLSGSSSSSYFVAAFSLFSSSFSKFLALLSPCLLLLLKAARISTENLSLTQSLPFDLLVYFFVFSFGCTAFAS